MNTRSESQLPPCPQDSSSRRRSVTFADEIEGRASAPLPSAHAMSTMKGSIAQRSSLSHEYLCVGQRGSHKDYSPCAVRRSKSIVNSSKDAQIPGSASNSFGQLSRSKPALNLLEDTQESAHAAAFPFKHADPSCFPEPFSESPRSSSRKQANSSRLAAVLSWKMSRRSSASSQGTGSLENEPGMQALTRRSWAHPSASSVGPSSPYSSSRRSSMAYSSTENAFVVGAGTPTGHQSTMQPAGALSQRSSIANSSTENAFASQGVLPFTAALRRSQDVSCPEDCSEEGAQQAGSIQGFPSEAPSKRPSSQGHASNLWCKSEGPAAPASRLEDRPSLTSRTAGGRPASVNLTSTSHVVGGRPASASHSERKQPTSHTTSATSHTTSHVTSGRPKGFAALRASVAPPKVLRPKSNFLQ